MSGGAILTEKTCYIAPGVKCQFTGTASPSDLATSPQWTISGTKTIAFAVVPDPATPDQSTGSMTPYPGSDLEQYVTDKFYWSDNNAGSKTVQFSVSLNGTSESATAHFTYEVPTSIQLNNSKEAEFKFAHSMLNFVNPLTFEHADIGVALGPAWTPPAHWTLSQNNPSAESQQFAQLMSGLWEYHHPATASSSDYWVKRVPTDGLDSLFPYPKNAGATSNGSPLVWSDSPRMPIYSDTVNQDGTPNGLFPADDDQINLSCSFTAYWAYEPAANEADFVPLKAVHWYVHGDMKLNSGTDPGVDPNWTAIVTPDAEFADNGVASGWYQWTQVSGNASIPTKE